MSLSTITPEFLAENPDVLPDYQKLLALPERILQFGTGVLLRGLPDYFVNEANQQGIFNGRIVVVKSTSTGGADAFADQSSIFSHTIRGIENNERIDKTVINTAISRTLSANQHWTEILECAANPDMQVVFSNTTEVGIQLVDDDIFASPPVSFPGKLTSFLYERYLAFNGSSESGMVIVPTELIIGNGEKLQDIILQQAIRHDLDKGFIRWIEEYNYFCNSLVDRIVPGKPDTETIDELSEKSGFKDGLLIVSEVYRLWAIEASQDRAKQMLSFAAADSGVVIASNIDIYRELKLRLLNGTHTLSCGLCFLEGLDTVGESMENPSTAAYIQNVMLDELAPAIPYKLDLQQAKDFGQQVLDRFRNPFIRHQLIDITVQYSAKMKMRNVPTLLNHYRKYNQVPALVAKGFAAYLQFMKAVSVEDGIFYGERKGQKYPIRCDAAVELDKHWKHAETLEELVSNVLSDKNLWDTDLTVLPGFKEAVLENLVRFE